VAALPFQLYEAYVVDGAPDPLLPGHITVIVPELFGDDEIPFPIPPMVPGWAAGGWQSVPNATTPEGEDTMVIVAMLGPETFRWIGTSQAWSLITDDPGSAAGARSGDGRHRVYMTDTDGARMETDGGSGAKVWVNADGTVDVQGSTVRIAGDLIYMFDGGVVPPTDRYILSNAFFAAMINLCADVIAIGAGIPSLMPVPAPGATTLLSGMTTSLSSGPPYLSARIFGS
jgi:hypothetical protein